MHMITNVNSKIKMEPRSTSNNFLLSSVVEGKYSC